MKIYHIALGIIIFTASIQMVNDLGIFVTPLPTEHIDSAQGKVSRLTNTTDATAVNDIANDFMGGFGILRSLGYLVSAFGAAIVIVPLLSSYQVPLTISIPIQAMIYFVYGIGIIQFLTGRGTKYYD